MTACCNHSLLFSKTCKLVAVTGIFYFVWYIYNSRIDLIISYSNTYCKFPYLSICSIFQVRFNVAGKQINFRMRITMWHTDTEKIFNSYLHKSGSDADPDQGVLNPFELMTCCTKINQKAVRFLSHSLWWVLAWTESEMVRRGSTGMGEQNIMDFIRVRPG